MELRAAPSCPCRPDARRERLSRVLHSGGLRCLGYRISAVGLLLALVAIVQNVTIRGAEIDGFWTPEQGTTPYGPFVNRHHFAGWMVMALSLAMRVVLAGIAARQAGRETGLAASAAVAVLT